MHLKIADILFSLEDFRLDTSTFNYILTHYLPILSIKCNNTPEGRSLLEHHLPVADWTWRLTIEEKVLHFFFQFDYREGKFVLLNNLASFRWVSVFAYRY